MKRSELKKAIKFVCREAHDYQGARHPDDMDAARKYVRDTRRYLNRLVESLTDAQLAKVGK